MRQNPDSCKDAISRLEQGNAIGALDAIYGSITTVMMPSVYEEVFNYFTDYVFWSAKRAVTVGERAVIVHHEEPAMFQLGAEIKEKIDFRRGRF